MSASPEYACAAAPELDASREKTHRRAFFGTALLSTANVTKLLLQCALIPVLARLLGPHVFGLMSVAMSFVLLANMLSDGGMGAALIREHDCEHALESTVFWLSMGIGLALAAIVGLIAWPVAIIYSEAPLLPVMLALSPILMASSSLSVLNARIIRQQRFNVFAIGDVACAIAGAGVGLFMALRGYGVWSLVGQQLAFWATKAVWIWRAAGFRPSATLNLELARPLFGFSANTLATNIADFLGKNLPILIVGGTLGVASVARYAMAYQLTRVAEMVVSDPVNLATFSAVAAARRHEEATGFVIVALRTLLLVLLPLFGGLALTADLLAPIILGHRWIGTGPALAMLAPGALCLCLYGFANGVLLGKGLSAHTLKLTVLTGVATALGTLVGVRAGVSGAVTGLSLGAASLAPLYLWVLAKTLDISIFTLLKAGRAGAFAALTMGIAVLLVRWEARALAAYLQLILAIGVGAVSFCSAALAAGGPEIRAGLETLRRRAPAEEAAQPSIWPSMPKTVDDAEPFL